jgi:hypothetical protein
MANLINRQILSFSLLCVFDVLGELKIVENPLSFYTRPKGYKTYLSLESTQLSIWLNSVLATSNDNNYLHVHLNDQNCAYSALLFFKHILVL